MSPRLKILVIGGYGTFGGRIVQLLAPLESLTLIVAGRSAEKARALCAGHGRTAAALVPAAFDREGDMAAQLAAYAPDIVIDASGPFQAYGEGRYRVIEGCLAARVNYLDLADGSDFVAGAAAFDAAAKAAGVFVLSGVSSFPVLTAAVVRRLAGDLGAVEEIRAGIAPSPFAGVGENVIRAIASYCGQPVPLRREGRTATGYPLTEQMRYVIAPPGRTPVHDTLFSLVDVPDLRALAELWPEARDIWMGAGPTPEILHRCLIGLSWLVRWRWAASLAPLAGLMHWASNRLRWGEHRGGMFVEIVGRDVEGLRRRRSWHLLAEGDDGPLIPAMAVEGIVHRILAGRLPAPGARAAVRDLELEDYETLFAERAIATGVREEEGGGLYRSLLGAAFDNLPAAIREMHEGAGVAEGWASVERGTGLLSRLAAAVGEFPEAAARTPVRVAFDRTPLRETWRRSFGRERFRSQQFAGAGRSRRLLVERFGVFDFSMALASDGGTLRLVVRRWSFLGLPLPMWFCPRINACESVRDGLFHFHIEIAHPWTGLIVRYRGSLRIADGSAPSGKVSDDAETPEPGRES